MFEPILEDVCPKCGNNIYSEGIDNGIGYVYPPFIVNVDGLKCVLIKMKKGVNNVTNMNIAIVKNNIDK